MTFGQVACSHLVSCHPFSTWRGQVACSQPISSHPLGTWRGQVACSRPISCHSRPHPRCSARDVWPGGLLSADILPSCEHLWRQAACSQSISCHPLGICRGQVACSQQITCHPLPCPRCFAFGQVACSQPISCHPLSTCGPGGLLSADILPSFGHLARPGGLLLADNLLSSAIPSVFCACRLGRWPALSRYPAIL